MEMLMFTLKVKKILLDQYNIQIQKIVIMPNLYKLTRIKYTAITNVPLFSPVYQTSICGSLRLSYIVVNRLISNTNKPTENWALVFNRNSEENSIAQLFNLVIRIWFNKSWPLQKSPSSKAGLDCLIVK